VTTLFGCGKGRYYWSWKDRWCNMVIRFFLREQLARPRRWTRGGSPQGRYDHGIRGLAAG
jgi:hypothetical protein